MMRVAKRAGAQAWPRYGAQRTGALASHAHDTAVGPATRPTLGYDTAKVSATIRRWAGHDTACARRLGVLAGSVGPSWCTVHLAQF